MLKWNIWGRMKNAGNPWHGQITDGVLTLPNGATKPVVGSPQPTSDTRYVAFGLPQPETSAREVLQGALWTADAILFGAELRYSPTSPLGFASSGTQWLFRTPTGVIRRMSCSLEILGNPVQPYDIGVGETRDFTLTIYASGTQIAQQTVSVSNEAANMIGYPAVWLHYQLPVPLRWVSPHPSGVAAFLNFMVYPTSTPGGGDDALFLARYCAAKVFRIDVSETVPGTTVAVISVTRTEAQCMSWLSDGSGTVTHYINDSLWGAHWTPQGDAVDIRYRYEFYSDTTVLYDELTQIRRGGTVVYEHRHLYPGDAYWTEIPPRDDWGTSGIESDARLSTYNTLALYLRRWHGTGLGSELLQEQLIAVAPSGPILETAFMLNPPDPDAPTPTPIRWRVSFNPRTQEWAYFGRLGSFQGGTWGFQPGGACWV